jgi:dihydrofolate synthase/folylpolyglutamate synthase
VRSPARDYPTFLERLRAYERVEPFPQSRKPDKLAPVRRLLELLEHPETGYRIVHVAGTNGKGMTSAMVAALLKAAGFCTGLYTSPHVVDLRERIMLNGNLIGESALASSGHTVLDLADEERRHLDFSYFDVLTVIGLLAFREARCDWAVLETGMGGLSDATNAVDKHLTVLTRIGFDHMYVLGNTLREIATQKLGIVRPGIPTILAPQEPELEDWMAAQIQERGSPLQQAGAFRISVPDSPAQQVSAIWSDEAAIAVHCEDTSLTTIKAICAGTALCAAEILLGPARSVDRENRLRTAMATTLPARLERRSRQGIVESDREIAALVLDGGHNAGALNALADELTRWGMANYLLIIGLQADKLVEPIEKPLTRLLSGAKRVFILAPRTARAPTTAALSEFLSRCRPAQAHRMVEEQPDPRTALLAAADSGLPVVATGSFWMLGDLMRLLVPH